MPDDNDNIGIHKYMCIWWLNQINSQESASADFISFYLVPKQLFTLLSRTQRRALEAQRSDNVHSCCLFSQ